MGDQGYLADGVLAGDIHHPPYRYGKSGALTINQGGQATEYHLMPEKTFGEAERSTFKNIRQPTMLYGYICAVRPQATWPGCRSIRILCAPLGKGW